MKFVRNGQNSRPSALKKNLLFKGSERYAAVLSGGLRSNELNSSGTGNSYWKNEEKKTI